MNSIVDQIKSQYKAGAMNMKLIIINVSVFVLAVILSLVVRLFVKGFDLIQYFAAPAEIGELLYKPWTIITHMFYHLSLGHLFWNMVMLYFIGNIFVNRLGNKKTLSVYLAGGLFGFLFSWLCYSIFPTLVETNVHRIMMGASAGISAIMVAIGFYAPNTELRIPFIQKSVKLLHVILFFILLDIVRLNADIGNVDGNSGGWLAHIGGSIFGYFYATFLLKGKNILKWFEKFLSSFFSIITGNFKLKRKTKLKVKKGGNSSKPPRDDYEYNAQKKTNQERVDAILDKINISGYESLTQVEKDFLFAQK